MLCKLFKCSKSGYYSWVQAGRPSIKAFNSKINELIISLKNKTSQQNQEQKIIDSNKEALNSNYKRLKKGVNYE